MSTFETVSIAALFITGVVIPLFAAWWQVKTMRTLAPTEHPEPKMPIDRPQLSKRKRLIIRLAYSYAFCAPFITTYMAYATPDFSEFTRALIVAISAGMFVFTAVLLLIQSTVKSINQRINIAYDIFQLIREDTDDRDKREKEFSERVSRVETRTRVKRLNRKR